MTCLNHRQPNLQQSRQCPSSKAVEMIGNLALSAFDDSRVPLCAHGIRNWRPLLDDLSTGPCIFGGGCLEELPLGSMSSAVAWCCSVEY